MERPVHLVNGHIRNSVWRPQFEAVCQALSVEPKKSLPLAADSPYAAGLGDADGTIHLSGVQRDRPYPAVSAVTKNKMDPESFFSFGGKVYPDRMNGAHRWQTAAEEDLLNFHSYFLRCVSIGVPFRSAESGRLTLIPQFH